MQRLQGNVNLPAFSGETCTIEGTLDVPKTGQTILQVRSPRALRLWIDGALALDEPLYWRRYERELRALVSLPLKAGPHTLRIEAGKRSGWHKEMDVHCPSRNREIVRAALVKRHPDQLEAVCEILPGVTAPAASLRFLPTQFIEDGITWQHLVAREIAGFCPRPPTTEYGRPEEAPVWGLVLRSTVAPFEARDISSVEERTRGARRYAVPVGNALQPIPEVRTDGREPRVEPECEIATRVEVSLSELMSPAPPYTGALDPKNPRVAGADTASFQMPVFEERGRLAPRRERKDVSWPTPEELLAGAPRPIVPGDKAHWVKLHDHAWKMFLNLRRKTNPYSGLPNDYVGTSLKGFLDDIFVWDSSFTAMSYAWGHRVFPTHATLDVLLARQFDGGYLHREINVHEGMADGYEPDFSPNPPIPVVAEWKKALLSGDLLRLSRIYPSLCASHAWLRANRRLPNGVYWTTGLANGLDNSPSMGDGYPDLTCQMAHAAEMLSLIANALGRKSEAATWEAERQTIGAAMNEILWSDKMKFFSTSLPGGGHNTNKVATGFWPLWTGLVPRDRVDCLAEHLLDPKSFWRHHPIPSLAADSPQFEPGGNYWLGSTWAPTNAATIWGFDRAGCHDLAVKLTARHLDVMYEVYEKTGRIWENYCSEKSERGNISGPDYSWTALSPIAHLYEIIIGIRPDALNNRIEWMLPADSGYGVERMAFGNATINLLFQNDRSVKVTTDRAFELVLCADGRKQTIQVPMGTWSIPQEKKSS